MTGITFEQVGRNYDKVDAIKKIYEEAFPANERALTVEQMLTFTENNSNARIIAALEEDRIVGFFAIMEKEEYVFLFYLAVNKELRGGGYGTRIMNAMIEHFGEKILMFDIETPIEGKSNYEQRVKRQIFYDRLGCINTGIAFDYGNDNYTLYVSRQTDKAQEYLEDLIKLGNELAKQFHIQEKIELLLV